MPGDDKTRILRRKLIQRPDGAGVGPVDTGPAGDWVRAFTRALSAATPLVVESAALHRKTATLTELLDSLEPDAFVITLVDDARVGVALIDQIGFSAVIEAMTIGRLSTRASPHRRATATDAVLLASILDSSLANLRAGDPAQVWRTAKAVPDHRLLGVLLDDGDYDLVALTTRLVAGDVARPARLLLALPCMQARADPASVAAEGGSTQQCWSDALQGAVLAAPACLRAELGRVTLPLVEVLGLGIGSTLTLPLSNLEEVRLVALDGTPHGIGRLGQTRGNRAVRLTAVPGHGPEPVMQDVRPSLRQPEDGLS